MAAGADRRAGGYHARGDTLSRARTWHCDQHRVALAVLRRARNQRQKKAFARRSSCAPTWLRLARSGSANRRRLIPTGSFSSTRPEPTRRSPRLRGRWKRGESPIGNAPYGHRKTTTFVAGLRKNAITAPLVIDQTMNGEIFVAWLVQFLIPTLIAGDIVVMDNLPVHKILAVRALIEAAGAKLLYLPSYSPDLN